MSPGNAQPGPDRTRRKGRLRGHRGAALVEFALLAPMLFGVLFGIIDFGYNFSRTLDIRHGSREGSRLAAVNYNGGTASVGSAQASVVIAEICRRMDGAKGATVTLTLPDGTVTQPAGTVGTSATVTVSRPANSLSGLYKPLFNGKTMTSTVTTRIEVKSTWATATGVCT